MASCHWSTTLVYCCSAAIAAHGKNTNYDTTPPTKHNVRPPANNCDLAKTLACSDHGTAAVSLAFLGSSKSWREREGERRERAKIRCVRATRERGGERKTTRKCCRIHEHYNIYACLASTVFRPQHGKHRLTAGALYVMLFDLCPLLVSLPSFVFSTLLLIVRRYCCSLQLRQCKALTCAADLLTVPCHHSGLAGSLTLTHTVGTSDTKSRHTHVVLGAGRQSCN